ncbi:MAG: hypothetical protein E7395_07060 [Ruminococcaceae bacterium]|nr:hypothetical protein [Oscillospiraceae bacterium]
MYIEKLSRKLKQLYEFVSFAMVILFVLLPVFTFVGPQNYYGKLFKSFSYIEVFVLLVCLLGYLLFFAFKAYKTSFSATVLNTKTNVAAYFSARKYALLLLIVYVLMVVSAFLASDRQRAFLGTDFRPDGVLMHSAFLALFVFASALKKNEYKKFIVGLYVVSFILVSLVMVQQYYGIIGASPVAPTPKWAKPLMNFYDSIGIRVGHFYKGTTGTFYNLNHMGYYSCMCAMICTGVFLKSKGNLAKVFSLLLCAYAYWVVTINNTFGCYIAVFAAIVSFFAVAFFRFKSCRIKAALPIAVFLAVTLVVSVSPTLSGESVVEKNFSVFTKDVKKVATSNEDEDTGEAGSGRWKAWLATIDMIKEKPFFGFGPDNLKEEYTEREVKVDRAHNEILERAVSTGIPSAIFYAGAMIVALLSGFRKNKLMDKDSCALPALLASCAYIVSALFGVFLFYTACHFFVLLPMSAEEDNII